MAPGELTASGKIARAAGVAEHRFVEMPQLMELSDMKSRERFEGLPSTYIPMKNVLYYGLAAAYAEETASSRIVGGHNREDLRDFEDTGDEFFLHLEKALLAASGRLRRNRMKVWRPLKEMSKVEVVSLADRLGVPLGLTWSCHMEGTEHCWRCRGCITRRRSFAGAGVADPLRSASTKNV
jgi:7-cyano-7-deazaguanine synthase